MEDEKFQVVFENKNNIWFAGNPVQIKKVQVLLDSEMQKEFLICELLNSGEGVIKYASVDVICYKADGSIITAIKDAAITGVYALPHSLFGIDSPIALPSAEVMSVKVTPSRIVYDDGNTWRTEGNSGGKVLPEPKKSDYPEAIMAQFELECEKEGAKALYKFEEFQDYWNCTCGQHNESSRTECVLCRTKRDWLAEHTAPDHLVAALEKRLTAEKNERIRKEKEDEYERATALSETSTEKDLKEAASIMEKLMGFKDSVSKAEEFRKAAAVIHAENAKKRRRNTIIITAVSIAAAIIIAAILTYTLYYVPHTKYVEADSLLTSGKFDAAKEEFISIGGFSDASEKAKECDYQKAQGLLDAGEFDSAKELFTTVADYSDADKKIMECDYQKAVSMMNAGSLDEAKEIFSTIASYSDAASMRSECDYRKAINLKTAGSYTEAVDLFSTITGYSDSADQCNDAMYLYCTSAPNYSHDNATTMTYLKALSDAGYKDSADLYSKLSRWYASLIYNEGAEDYETEALTLGIYHNHYFHIKASGGGLNEQATFKWTVEINSKTFEGLLENITDGSTATFGWANGDSAYTGGAGDMTVKIYNNATGELLVAKLFYISSK